MNISQNWKYGLVIIASVVLSLGGILYAAAVQRPLEAGRGGAVTVALSFLILFLRENHGLRVQKALSELSSEESWDTVAALRDQLRALCARLNVNDDGQQRQNRALAWTSCIGTLTWGFGDVVAQWIQNACSICLR